MLGPVGHGINSRDLIYTLQVLMWRLDCRGAGVKAEKPARR